MKKKPIYALIAVAAVVLLLLGLLLWDPVIDALPIDQSGWKTKGESRYYLDEDGDPITGWQTVDGQTYYFDPESGAMATGWLDIEENRYYFRNDGILATGWLSNDQGSFYLLPDGAMATFWQELEGKVYYFGADGACVTGWQDIEDHRYYFDESGIRQSGWVTVEDTAYYLDEDGALYQGWLEVDGLRYYIREDGTAATGWQELDVGRCYFNEDGTLYTGWMDTETGRCYLNPETGAIHLGWLELDGNTYYLKEDGTTVKGRLVIDEQTYYFTSTGAQIWLVNPWNELPEDYEVELVELESGHKVSVECYDALMRMLADCEAAGFDPYLYSSYRTYAHQQRLFNKMIEQEGSAAAAAKIVAPPGTSEHQLGLAVDITDSGFRKLNKEQEKTPTQKWLMEHCWEYGFIMRYPNDKKQITGIIYEPWHYRYVGVELAMELKELGLCLEEYLDMLTGDGTTCGGAVPKTE